MDMSSDTSAVLMTMAERAVSPPDTAVFHVDFSSSSVRASICLGLGGCLLPPFLNVVSAACPPPPAATVSADDEPDELARLWKYRSADCSPGFCSILFDVPVKLVVPAQPDQRHIAQPRHTIAAGRMSPPQPASPVASTVPSGAASSFEFLREAGRCLTSVPVWSSDDAPRRWPPAAAPAPRLGLPRVPLTMVPVSFSPSDGDALRLWCRSAPPPSGAPVAVALGLRLGCWWSGLPPAVPLRCTRVPAMAGSAARSVASASGCPSSPLPPLLSSLR